MSGLTATPQGGSGTQLLNNASYNATGHITSASIGGGLYSYGANYDGDSRLTALSVTRASDSTLLYNNQRGYDAMGNVTAALTTLPAGTDSQAYCYDEQNRLVWASSASATGPCGASNSAGSLSGAQYSQTFGYDTLDRLTSGPVGSYTYGDSAHLHAVTSIGPSGSPTYTASYDAAGNLACRAPDATTTCAGTTPTGAQLAFNPRSIWRAGAAGLLPRAVL